jgi:hypothetical protein
MLVQLPRHEEAPRDLELLVFAIARDFDDLDALLERIGHEVDVVRAQNDHRVREVD